MIYAALWISVGIIFSVVRYRTVRRVVAIVLKERAWKLPPTIIEFIGVTTVIVLWPVFLAIDLV